MSANSDHPPKRWPRWAARIRAGLGGYFYVPCPTCGEPFAGFEWKIGDYASIPIRGEQGVGVGICPTCAWKGLAEKYEAKKEYGHTVAVPRVTA